DPRFHNTAIFPIFDLYNRVVGVSARTLIQGPLKYVNTIYPKTQHLYGLSVTWQECLKQNKVYIVEGNVDVLRLYQSGIRNVVGMLGSMLKEYQLILLSRFVENVVVVPDGDEAGRKNLEKINNNQIFKEKLDLNVSTVSLPANYDPDTFLLSHSAEDFYQLEQRTN
ncbi:MAG: toprim domain-containing protein, partial [Nitrosotalea sp.]